MFTTIVSSLAPLLFLFQAAPPSAPPPPADADTYVIGAGDQIVVRANVEEIPPQAVPIDKSGVIDLPLAGRIKASGLTTDQLSAAIEDRLKKFYVHPDVSVYVAESRSEPVSVLGSVGLPGVHQLQGEKTLFEVLSSAGGLRPDAGSVVNISRKHQYGKIPLPNAKDDSTGEYSVASVDVKAIMSASGPAENIPIKPEDVITVPAAEIVYAIGAVKKQGGFVLGSNRSIGAVQVLALADGADRGAKPSKAKIMRPIPGTNDHTEIPVDLKKIENGAPDVPLQANDILFVPTSTAKLAALRTIDVLAAASTAAIYKIP